MDEQYRRELMRVVAHGRATHAAIRKQRPLIGASRSHGKATSAESKKPAPDVDQMISDLVQQISSNDEGRRAFADWAATHTSKADDGYKPGALRDHVIATMRRNGKLR